MYITPLQLKIEQDNEMTENTTFKTVITFILVWLKHAITHRNF